MKNITLALYSLLLFIGFSTTSSAQNDAVQASPTTVAPGMLPLLSICYNDSVPPLAYDPFTLIVVNSSYPATHIQFLQQRKKTVLAHLNLAKVKPEQGWFKPLQSGGLLKAGAEGSSEMIIDVENRDWEQLLLKALIPQLIKKGFDGLLLDDLDFLYQSKKQAWVIALIAKMKKQFPELKLMAQGGLRYLPSFATEIDYLVIENYAAKNQKLTHFSELPEKLGQLNIARKVNPKLLIYALDYYTTSTPPTLKADHLVFIATLRELHFENTLSSCVTVESLDAAPIRPPG
ncbi:MAG: endo alpha-1,4 polygalactosaminidase [Verrucomicrobiales bacterium]|nr:endo alpha-1,4 polygalactosaminidase [Verrucomicrobiales bacterium]